MPWKGKILNCPLWHMLLVLGACMASSAMATAETMPQMIAHISLSSPVSPVIMRGSALISLLGAPVARINAIARHGTTIKAIPFQIDKRDIKGGYELSAKYSRKVATLDANDECVFMVSDAGEKITTLPEQYAEFPVMEIVIIDPKTQERKWVYLIKTPRADGSEVDSNSYVVYDATNDTIQTNIYKIGFSSTHPFMIDSFQWHLTDSREWSPNVFDTMKIRHHGKFFGKLDFSRTHADYRSRVTAVKSGPIRVIRRTINSIRIISYLQSPSITIDFIAYGQGFQMDTTIDLPFPPGWFFSDMSALATIDWNDDPSLPALRIYGDNAKGLLIEGRMTPEKDRFNKADGQNFLIESTYGLVLVQLEIEKNLPLKVGNYLQDDRSQADKPEIIPGQFGNVGFITTGWEKVDASTHHMLFNVLLLQNATAQQGMEIQGYHPWKAIP